MRICLNKLFRPVAVALVLGFSASPAAEASWRTTQATTRESRTDGPQRDPVIGVVAIAAGVAVLIFLAWIAARIGDSGR